MMWDKARNDIRYSLEEHRKWVENIMNQEVDDSSTEWGEFNTVLNAFDQVKTQILPIHPLPLPKPAITRRITTNTVKASIASPYITSGFIVGCLNLDISLWNDSERQKIKQKMIFRWMKYVHQSKIMSKKHRKATEFCIKSIKSKYLEFWTKSIRKSAEFKRMQADLHQIHENKLVEAYMMRWYIAWKRSRGSRVIQKRISALTVRYRLFQWQQNAMFQQRYHKIASKVAKNRMRVSWRSLQLYVKARRRKLKQKKKAMEFFIVKMIEFWSTYTETRQKHKRIVDRTLKILEKRQMDRVMCAWQGFVDHQHHIQRLVLSSRNRLVKHSMKLWGSYVRKKRRDVFLKTQARVFYHLLLQRKLFQYWSLVLEIQANNVSRAEKQYVEHLQARSIREWIDFKRMGQLRRQMHLKFQQRQLVHRWKRRTKHRAQEKKWAVQQMATRDKMTKLKSWNCWKTEFGMRLKEQQAVEYYSELIEKKAFDHWHQLLHELHWFENLCSSADKYYKKHVIQQSFQLWKHYLAHRRALLVKHAMSIMMDRRNTMTDSFAKWQNWKRRKRQSCMKRKAAIEFFNQRSQLNVLVKWKEGVATLKLQARVQEAKANVCFVHAITLRMYRYWMNFTEKNIELQSISSTVTERSYLHRSRHSIRLWQGFQERQHQKHSQHLKATQQYTFSLKRTYINAWTQHFASYCAWMEICNQIQENKQRRQMLSCFAALSRHVVQCQIDRKASERVSKRHKRQDLRTSWRNWRQGYKNRIERNQYVDSKFNDHVKQRCRSVFRMWRRHAMLRAEIVRECEALALERRNVAGRQVFIHWRRFVATQYQYRQVSETLLRQQKLALIHQSWRSWRTVYASHLRSREIIMTMSHRRMKRSKRQFFILWQHAWEIGFVQRCREIKAADYYDTTTAKAGLVRWIQHARRKRDNAFQKQRAIEAFQFRCSANLFRAWKLSHRRCKKIRQKLLSADAYYQRRVKMQCFAHLLECMQSRRLRQRAEQMVLLGSFSQWKDHHCVKRHERYIEYQALTHYEIAVRKRVLHVWFRSYRSLKKKTQQLQIAREHFETTAVRKSFRTLDLYHIWRRRRQRANQAALNHMKDRLLTFHYEKWRKVIASRRHLATVTAHALENHRIRTVKIYFREWNTCIRLKLAEKKLVRQCKKSIKCRFFMHWLDRRGKRASCRLLVRITQHHLLQQLFTTWHEMTSCSARIETRVSALHLKHVLSTSFRGWKCYVAMIWSHRFLALRRGDTRTKSKYWRLWRSYLRIKSFSKRYIIKLNTRRLEYYLSRWQMDSKLSVLQFKSECRLSREKFNLWREWIALSLQVESMRERQLDRLKQRIWIAWRTWFSVKTGSALQQRPRRRTAYLHSVVLYKQLRTSRASFQRVLETWKQVVWQKKEIRQKISIRLKLRLCLVVGTQIDFKRSMFYLLVHILQNRRNHRHQSYRAMEFWSFHLQRTWFQNWKAFREIRIETQRFIY